jgi:transposase
MPAVCGIDWADDWHDARVSDADGMPLAQQRFSHDEGGITALLALLSEHAVELVAIERPDGLLVGRLLAAGVTVIAIHPNQVAAARDRFRAAAGKTDSFDSYVLCELAHTDRHRFHALAPSHDETTALRALVRTREDLVAARVALANQLRAQLDAFWPGARRIFAAVDSPIALAFPERYPAPGDAHGLGPKRLQAFLARHAYWGRRPAPELLQRLRSAPVAIIGELEADARRQTVLGLVAALHPIVEQISQLTSQIAGAVRAHPDGPIFLSLFRDHKSVITAAGLLAEIGDNRHRYPTRDSLAADAGMAPVAIESGKRRAAVFRWACDKRLRGHMCVLADSTRHWHPWAHDLYQRARARGADHPHAIRILGRAWARVLWRC